MSKRSSESEEEQADHSIVNTIRLVTEEWPFTGRCVSLLLTPLSGKERLSFRRNARWPIKLLHPQFPTFTSQQWTDSSPLLYKLHQINAIIDPMENITPTSPSSPSLSFLSFSANYLPSSCIRISHPPPLYLHLSYNFTLDLLNAFGKLSYVTVNCLAYWPNTTIIRPIDN